MERVILVRDPWTTLKMVGLEEACKVVFIVANAETEPDIRWDQRERAPRVTQVLKSASSVWIKRYNFETMELLRQNLQKWAYEIHVRRGGVPSHTEGTAETTSELWPCKDIGFYLVEVNFEALADESERASVKGLPTSFNLPPETVDQLRHAARQILTQSAEFQRLLRDLR